MIILSGMMANGRRMYSYLPRGVHRYKCLISIPRNFARGVDITELNSSFDVVSLAVGVLFFHGEWIISPPIVSLVRYRLSFCGRKLKQMRPYIILL